jgi:hypothetical protein
MGMMHRAFGIRLGALGMGHVAWDSEHGPLVLTAAKYAANIEMAGLLFFYLLFVLFVCLLLHVLYAFSSSNWSLFCQFWTVLACFYGYFTNQLLRCPCGRRPPVFVFLTSLFLGQIFIY